MDSRKQKHSVDDAQWRHIVAGKLTWNYFYLHSTQLRCVLFLCVKPILAVITLS